MAGVSPYVSGFSEQLVCLLWLHRGPKAFLTRLCPYEQYNFASQKKSLVIFFNAITKRDEFQNSRIAVRSCVRCCRPLSRGESSFFGPGAANSQVSDRKEEKKGRTNRQRWKRRKRDVGERGDTHVRKGSQVLCLWRALEMLLAGGKIRVHWLIKKEDSSAHGNSASRPLFAPMPLSTFPTPSRTKRCSPLMWTCMHTWSPSGNKGLKWD